MYQITLALLQMVMVRMEERLQYQVVVYLLHSTVETVALVVTNMQLKVINKEQGAQPQVFQEQLLVKQGDTLQVMVTVDTQ